MVAIRGRGRIRRQTCLSSFSILAIASGAGGAHVLRMCYCVTLSYGAISELEVRFFVVLAVCHQGAVEYFVFGFCCCGLCGREVFADVVWRVCVGLHRILGSWLRCVTKASPASCVFGYPAWFADTSRGGVRQTTVDGLPRVIKFGREAFVDVVWKGCLRGCIVSGALGCGA